MKVIEHLANAARPLISFEIIPPKRGGDIKALLSVIDDIAKFQPPFIDITSHAAEVVYDETPTGLQRKIKRKRPGTLGICALIQNKYNIDAVPHIICRGFTREETEDFMIELSYLGIENVLAVRGDENTFKKPLQYGRSANEYAVDLVKQITSMNAGKYLEQDLLDAKPTNFCVGVGGYPEKHYEAPSLKADIRFAKDKVVSGADYIVTQMFFDNQKYFNYVKCCREEGINVPIIPGLKIITSKTQLVTIPKNFYIDLPDDLTEEILKAKPEHVEEIGINHTLKQVEELLNNNVPAVHFYIMQNSKHILSLMKKLKI
ncbi:MAG TPA: methylenetetrahydrofolate reductase [Ignavibacteriales bacterium]|nr:methylenetetrahydrofolate reductase [Ignavibacteriales bacterium]